MMNSVFKMMNSVFKTMNSVFKTMNSVFKMMNSPLRNSLIYVSYRDALSSSGATEYEFCMKLSTSKFYFIQL